MRVLGFLLLGMGGVILLLTALALAGIVPLQIDFFGLNLDTRNERVALACGCLIVAVTGLVLLRIAKRSPHHAGPAA